MDDWTLRPEADARQSAGSKAASMAPRLKADVVAAVNGELLTVDEACARYELSAQELACWTAAAAKGGLKDLQIKRISADRRNSR